MLAPIYKSKHNLSNIADLLINRAPSTQDLYRKVYHEDVYFALDYTPTKYPKSSPLAQESLNQVLNLGSSKKQKFDDPLDYSIKSKIVELIKKSSEKKLTDSYSKINVTLNLGAGERSYLVESLDNLTVLLAKPYSVSIKDSGTESKWLRLAHEFHISTLVSHPNILPILNLVNDNKRIVAITEFCPKDLLQVVRYRQLTPEQIKDIMVQIISGVHLLHYRGISHRDLKLDNILMTPDSTVKITGFACAKISDTHHNDIRKDGISTSKEIVGSLSYMAPEVLSGKIHDTYKSDIWSIGIIYVMLCIGRFPWIVASKTDLFNGALSKDLRFKSFLEYPIEMMMNDLNFNEDQIRFALLMLNPVPQLRATTSELLNYLEFDDFLLG